MSEVMPANKRLLQGITWNSLHQIVQTALSFVVMLVLVRIIAPSEYGQAAAVVGILALVNAFSCQAFMSHTLQLPADVEPDWSLHFAVGLYIQGSLVLACESIATVCWFLPSYRTIAPLLHLAVIGLIFDWPTQLRIAMLWRRMEFRRYRLVQM